MQCRPLSAPLLQIYMEEFGQVKGHFGPINSVAFHPDGNGFVTGLFSPCRLLIVLSKSIALAQFNRYMTCICLLHAVMSAPCREAIFTSGYKSQ